MSDKLGAEAMQAGGSGGIAAVAPTRHSSDARAGRSLPASIALAWLSAIFVLLVLAAVGAIVRPVRTIADLFFIEQDLPWLVIATIFLFLLRIVPLAPLRIEAHPASATHRRLVVAALVGLVGMAGYLGVSLVQQGYALSMDEFMATFDTAIFQRGRLAAEVPVEWRSFLSALQPFYTTTFAENAYWSSSYLPMNAALRAVFAVLGSAAAASAFWAALSILLVYAIARRLWPERPQAALIAALLLATSRQVLVTASTPYAMSAHLALNLLWLWLFLGRAPWRHAAAILTSFVASGLHQVIFHPLFAAPFILQLWLDKRWRVAWLHTMAFAAICLFWMSYPGLLAGGGESAPAAGALVGLGSFLSTALRLIAAFDPASIGLMAKDLLRLIAWQNPLTIPLALCGTAAAWRAGGILRSLLLGLVLTIGALFVLMPYQTHGWGYRYLHGLLGSLVLLAAFAWLRFADTLHGSQKAALGSSFAAAAAFSVFVMLPGQAYQAHRFVKPYADAYSDIAARDVDVVLVDATELFYGVDLVRNDPFLEGRPKIMSVPRLDAEKLREICARYDVDLFATPEGKEFGIRVVDAAAGVNQQRALLQELGCLAPRLPSDAGGSEKG